MSGFKGTPGPYVTRVNSGDGLTIGVMRSIKGADIFIPLGHSAAVRNPGYLHGQAPIERDEAEANATMWASAPELLEALKELLAEYREWEAPRGGYAETHPAYKARAAIARALGESQ